MRFTPYSIISKSFVRHRTEVSFGIAVASLAADLLDFHPLPRLIECKCNLLLSKATLFHNTLYFFRTKSHVGFSISQSSVSVTGSVESASQKSREI
jgi:hypothetical protein